MLIGFRFAGWLLTAFFVMNCLVLIIVVLLQSGKAADLAGAFGGAGSQTAFGPRGAASLLSQATTWCAVMFMVCAMALVLRVDKAGGRRRLGSREGFEAGAGKDRSCDTVPVDPGAAVEHDSGPSAAPSSTPQTTPQSSSTPARSRRLRLPPHNPKSSITAQSISQRVVRRRESVRHGCTLVRGARARNWQPLCASASSRRKRYARSIIRPKNKIAGKPLRREPYPHHQFSKIWCGREDSNLHALRR